MRKNIACNSRGQTMIEYGLIIALIIAGIILGGPLIMSAINAHFKLLDNATQDSLTENIKSGVMQSTDCDWTDWQDSGTCGSGGCTNLDALYIRECKSGNDVIETETKCKKKASCCSRPVTVGCGALLESECSPSRSSVNNKFKTYGGYQGTCKLSNGTSSSDCRIGEKLVSITCGKITQDFSYVDLNDDEEGDDPIDILSSETFLACTTATFNECLPKCSPDLGDDDNPLFSKCHDFSDYRDLLEDEVISRKTTYAQQKPYRNITRFTPKEASQDSSIMNGTVKIPYAFVTSQDECNFNRYCEAYCEQIEGAVYLPTSDGTSCAKAVCEKTRYVSLDLPEHHFSVGPLPYTAKFTVDLFPNQNVTIIYFDENTNSDIKLSPDLSLYPQQIIESNYLSIDITPIDKETETAPGFSNLIFENECFAYRPSHLMTLNTPLLYACESSRKMITDARAYQRYCSAFDQYPYKNAIPYETTTHTIGCLIPESSSDLNYFVFCE